MSNLGGSGDQADDQYDEAFTTCASMEKVDKSVVQQNPASALGSITPLVEVAISIEFTPPVGSSQAHLGAFWYGLKERYPNVHCVQPLGASHEEFGKKGAWLPPALQFQLSNEPALRLQMTSANDEWMCQIQLDRIVVNWRKREGEYPRFPETWTKFKECWNDWLSFLENLSIPPPVPRGWDLTFVNRVFRDEAWSGPHEWPSIFPGLWGGAISAIDGCHLAGLRGQWVWDCTDSPARLYIDAKPGKLGTPPREALILALTARGPVSYGDSNHEHEKNSLSIHAIESGVLCGHDLVVEALKKVLGNGTTKE